MKHSLDFCYYKIDNHSERVSCTLRPDVTFIADNVKQALRLSKMEHYRKQIDFYNPKIDDLHLVQEIKDIIGDDLRLILREKPMIPPLTLAELNTQIFHILNGLNEAQERIDLNHNQSQFAAMTHGIGSLDLLLTKLFVQLEMHSPELYELLERLALNLYMHLVTPPQQLLNRPEMQ